MPADTTIPDHAAAAATSSLLPRDRFADSRFIRAARGLAVDATPVWFMRQAGRSLPEYRAIRERVGMIELIHRPELVAEVTLQPVRRHAVDAAILFSDIMTPLEGLGVGLEIREGVGPVIANPVRNRGDLDRLSGFEPADHVPYVAEAISILVGELTVPLIGFAGAPFTLASYLVEGGPSRTHARTKALMATEPELWADLLDRLADIAIASLLAQIDAGVSAIQLFDSWAGALSLADYERFVAPASQKVFAALRDRGVPRIHFGVGTGELLAAMGDVGADVVGVDWRVDLAAARDRVGERAVQGNLDPTMLLAPWEATARACDVVLAANHGRRGHIFNLGHGVLPETMPDQLTRLADYVHEKTAVPAVIHEKPAVPAVVHEKPAGPAAVHEKAAPSAAGDRPVPDVTV